MQQINPETQFKIMWRMQQILRKPTAARFKLTNPRPRKNGQLKCRIIYVSGATRLCYRFCTLLTHYYNPKS